MVIVDSAPSAATTEIATGPAVLVAVVVVVKHHCQK